MGIGKEMSYPSIRRGAFCLRRGFVGIRENNSREGYQQHHGRPYLSSGGKRQYPSVMRECFRPHLGNYLLVIKVGSFEEKPSSPG